MKTAAILSLVVIVGACQQRNEAAPQTASTAPVVAKSGTLTPEQLGTLGAQIRKEPSRGDELLQQHGLTRETFEKAIRDVTENTEASQRYAEAYRKASA